MSHQTSPQSTADSAHSDADVVAELLAYTQYLYGPLWQKGDPKVFVDQFFSSDAVVTASSGTETWHGTTELVAIISEVMADIKDLHPKVVWTRPMGKNAAAMFINFSVESRDPARQGDFGDKVKALYAWERTPAGWRAVADLSAYIGMDLPN
jgi:hypothetical protein